MNRVRARSVAWVLTLLLGASAIAAAGCGSSGNKNRPAPGVTPSTSASATVPSRTVPVRRGRFPGQLNTLCRQGHAAARAATDLNARIAVVQSYILKFQALTPPALEKATFAKFISGLNAEVAAARAKDDAALRRADAGVRLQGARLGAPDCADLATNAGG